MIGASKILTVSYGTFSCTLEGFDEPFNTMKAIAEYFRDLAAEDRYFGAEPPTPDAAMLHRIAEREIQRRVEAKIQDNGVILRTGDAMAEAALPAPMVQPALADAAVSADSVAARLSKLRGTAAPLATAVEAADDSYHEDQDADDLIANITAASTPADQAEVVLDELISAEITAVAEPVAAHAELAIAESEWQADDLDELDLPALDLPALELPGHDQADPDLAADLAEAASITEDDQADAFDDYDALAEFAEAEQLEELTRFDAQLIVDTDQPAADEADLDAQAADDALLASLGTLIDPDDQEYLDDDQDMAEAEPAAVMADPESVELGSVEPEPAALVAAPVLDDPQPLAEVEPVEPGRLQRARARVIKIRRADAPPVATTPVAAAPSLLSAEAEAALQAELAALEAELAPPAAVSVIDEADLAAELADLQAEPAEPTPAMVRPTRPVRSIAVAAPAAAADSIADQPAEIAEAPAEPRKRIEGDGADEAVSRLMAQTNSVMDGAEIKRRQSAIAHLKAAVVATEADRQVAPSQPKADRIDPYRHDLESVVRPRRAETANADRPSPLVLVSEQRIDRAPKAPATLAPVADAPRIVAPVRPRRIASGASAVAMQADSLLGGQDDDLDDDEDFDAEAAIAANLFSDAESFGDFAERLGAVELPDMLEAAAVYCAQVLGRPQFSRPMVLSQLATLPEAAAFSREDGLRVFGTLMRQGRIAKIKHGQFAVTDRSPLLAEAMRSAG